ncbi:MAG: histidine phosphatase family protein [Bacteroidia bacterium]|nr:histidine phosphatase family protein [Bacteroidia bacterium]
MIEIYFVRHGETDYNRKGIVQGSGIDSDLNDTGRQQAQSFFESYKGIEFDKVFVSELKRTHQTMAPWLELGYQFELSPGLNEFSWGIHEGVVPTPEQRADFQQLLVEWSAGNLSHKVERGESPIQAWDRAKSFFSEIQNASQGRYLMCSHGRQLRIIIANLLGEDMKYMEKYKHSNTGLSILQLEKDQTGKLHLLNNLEHLQKAEKV